MNIGFQEKVAGVLMWSNAL